MKEIYGFLAPNVGEVFKLGDRKFRAVEGSHCVHCAFDDGMECEVYCHKVFCMSHDEMNRPGVIYQEVNNDETV